MTLVLLRVVGAAPEQKLACRNDVKYLSYTLVVSLLDCMSTDYKGYCLGDMTLCIKKKVTGKVIQLQAWTGPDGSRRLRLPDFKTIGT